MEKMDGGRVAAVFTAHADFEARACGPATLGAHGNQLPDTLLIKAGEGVFFKNTFGAINFNQRRAVIT